MNIVITGGAGFIGTLLARTLLAQGSLQLAGAPAQAIERITLTDQVAPPADLTRDPRVEAVVGDLGELLKANVSGAQVVRADDQLLFHLAAAVSGECEANFDLGMRSNLDATRTLLETCRALASKPTLVFASSLAVFGDSPEQPLPEVLDDATLPTPQTSYGIQKYICEQLVSDFARKGFIRGRSVRLATVSVRPGKANGAASSFLSGIIREPLAGVRAVCPVPPDTPVALSSPRRTIEGLLRAAEAPDSAWGARTAINLPSFVTTPRKMSDSLARVAGTAVTDLIDWTPDAVISKIVLGWPARVKANRAAKLGLSPDSDFDAIVTDYMREYAAAKLPAKD